VNPISRHPCAPIRRKPRLRLERLDERVQPSAVYRTIDGTGNNLTHTTWGSAGVALIRQSPVAYGDGIDSPSLATDQSARAISNILNDQSDPANAGQDLTTYDQKSLSDFDYAVGQFMDHDIDLSPDGGAEMDIPVAAGDPIGPAALPFTRSLIDPTTGVTTPAQQYNAITAYFDLSQVYGSDAATAAALRTFSGGLMKTSPGNMLPIDNSTYFTQAQLAAINASVGGMANSGFAPTSDLFVTGDSRGNENIELTALQALFLRNHNMIATALHQQNPSMTDEQLYQEARKINIAEYQAIIYNEWIPDVLGQNALKPYSGYNPSVNPGIANEFSTVAFRFGHSLLSPEIERQNNAGVDIPDVTGDSDISLAEDFFDPYLLNPSGTVDPFTGQNSSDIGAILKGDADGVSQAMDPLAISDVRNLLFGTSGEGGQDLIALDIQRGRDHGLPDYNTMRAAYGLPRVTSFAQITSNVQVQHELEEAYGNVNDIDAFEGGLAEDHVPGSDVGPLFQAIMVNQFTRQETGDRFFYLNESWTPAETKIFQQGNTLAKVIEANTTITNLQSDVFAFYASISGTVFTDANHNARQDRGELGLANATVNLLDATDGSVIATTKTDRSGNYQFTAVEGLSTGRFRIQEVLPPGWTQTTAAPAVQAITRGDTFIGGINFGDYQGGSHTPPPPWMPPPNAPPPPMAPGSPHQPPPMNPPVTLSSVSLTAGPAIPFTVPDIVPGAVPQIDEGSSDWTPISVSAD
jgi:peroxidase